MVNKIKTLKNLNQKFPRFQLETLLTIIDCIEDEVSVFPINTTAQTKTFEPPYKVTCLNNKANCTTTDQYNPNSTITAAEYTPQEYYQYIKCKETSNKNGEEETNEVVATNDNGDVHVYVNGEECGIEFPAKSKKCPHLCDKTSCKTNIITEEDDMHQEEDDYDNDDDNDNEYDDILKKIIEFSY